MNHNTIIIVMGLSRKTYIVFILTVCILRSRYVSRCVCYCSSNNEQYAAAYIQLCICCWGDSFPWYDLTSHARGWILSRAWKTPYQGGEFSEQIPWPITFTLLLLLSYYIMSSVSFFLFSIILFILLFSRHWGHFIYFFYMFCYYSYLLWRESIHKMVLTILVLCVTQSVLV